MKAVFTLVSTSQLEKSASVPAFWPGATCWPTFKSRWAMVETSNLTEIEVVRISAGQAVTVTLDALPNAPLRGSVSQISPVFAEKQGDVTYTTRIKLADQQPLMRWGMTASVTFAK